jgi:ubiquinone/menaquinone biosynthesis C-methylase UbiE
MNASKNGRPRRLAAGQSSSMAPIPLRRGGSPQLAQGIPSYAPGQAAYHRAFRCELQRMLGDVFGGRIRAALDIACGDGVYARWLAKRCGAEATIWALDSNFSFLRLARRQSPQRRGAKRVLSIAGDALKLPFEDDTFDAVWCAQSLYSLPNPTAALEEMRRVTREGGVAAVLENDTLHEVVLPWPPELELAVRQAELESFRGEAADPNKFYTGRYLPRAFRAAGFARCTLKAYSISRAGPLDAATRTFLRSYLRRLRRRVAPRLAPRWLALLDDFVASDQARSLFDRPDFAMTCLNYVVSATKQGQRGES